MKALVLAGGTGMRLRPLSYSMPKQLIPVANKPVLFYCLESIRDAGITDVGVIVNAADPHVSNAIGDGSRFGLLVTFIPKARPLGLAHCVQIAESFLGDDPFVMYLGDNIVLDGIAAYAEAFRAQRPSAQILVTPVTRPSEFGIAELAADGSVLSLEEKPASRRSDLAIVGICFFSPAVHVTVRSVQPSGRGELEITDAISMLMAAGQEVRALPVQGFWQDVGRVENVLDCNRAILDALKPACDGLVDRSSEVRGAVSIGPGARVLRSRLTGPVVIGANAVITDSTLGPHVAVGDDAVLDRTAMANSIVLDRARVEEVNGVRDSVIGRDARILGTRRRRIIIGDDSLVEMIA
jgi:glucose-1-phosphate thymidylyltransferase